MEKVSWCTPRLAKSKTEFPKENHVMPTVNPMEQDDHFLFL